MTDIALEESLQCLMHKSDVRANIIERPTTSQCINVFCAIIKKLNESYKGDKKLFERQTFRSLMEKLNLYGGIKLLNAIDESDIIKFIDDWKRQPKIDHCDHLILTTPEPCL